MNQSNRPDDLAEEFPPGYDEVRVEIADPLDERPGNEDDDGVRHFCVILPSGEENCGGCGEPWACAKAQRLQVLQFPEVD
jgi:hypothetical protein